MRPILRISALFATVLSASAGQAFALTTEAAIESCRAKAHPQVVACVMAALNAANGRANVAVAIPTESTPKLAPGNALPAGFIPPPRTIADITAVLDSEKP